MSLDGHRLAALWDWLSTWIARDGGINGPVVHRGDLKRMLAIHDTPWTHEPIIQGLLELYRRSGNDFWLTQAIALGDAQCARQRSDSAFRWAGHEDDRFSSLIHNALADCALLDLANILNDRGDAARRTRYVTAAQNNLERYVIGALYRTDLRGFIMNPIDYYAGRDRFVVNMNSVAVEALIKLDRQLGGERHTSLVHTVGERIRSLQARHGVAEGGLPYSDLEPETHVPLYTALALRGLVSLATMTHDHVWVKAASAAAASLERLVDTETGLWYHKLEGSRLHRFPIFIAGAGIICNALLDVADATGAALDTHALASRLLRFQYRHGAIRNFIGYDHPDNWRPRGRATACWEDVYPTPNWSAHAFRFLSRVLPPPETPIRFPRRSAHAVSMRYVYVETRRVSVVVGTWPSRSVVAAIFWKALRYGFVIPGPHMLLRALVRRLTTSAWGRAALHGIRPPR